MLITKSAVQSFLSRPRRDHRGLKSCPPDKLKVRAEQLPIVPPIWSILKRHQKVCFLLGAHRRRMAIFNDMGTGKTIVAIALAEYFWSLGLIEHILVLVPRRPNKTEWVREIQKLSPGTPYCVLSGSIKRKWEQLEQTKALLIIDTYGGFTRLACVKKKVRRRRKKARIRLVPDRKLVRRIVQKFQGVISDEGTILGNKGNLIWRIVRQIVKQKEAIYFTLTGTPFGRDPTLLWGQMFLVDKGYTLGETLGLFRAAFFRSSINPFGGMEYTFLQKKMPLLHRLLAHSSIRFAANQAELPKVNFIRKYVNLPQSATKWYEEEKARLIKAHGNYQEQRNAFLRMRQISSGFVGFRNDETGAKAEFAFPINPKLEMLLSIVESIDPQYKVLIFYEYTFSGLRICKELHKLDIGHAHLYGGTKERDIETIRQAFNQSRSCQALVLQNSFGLGLNLQVARYGIYFEAPVSPIIRKQTQRRIERQHSQHKAVFIYDLIMRHTFDERILAFHKQGDDLFQAIIEGRAVI